MPRSWPPGMSGNSGSALTYSRPVIQDDNPNRDAVREAMLSKLEGLSEYDIRRPLTPTGTNLLGLIKHLSIIEALYFGETFGRPVPEHLRWRDTVEGTPPCGRPRTSHAPR
jgi:hypothetical protein